MLKAVVNALIVNLEGIVPREVMAAPAIHVAEMPRPQQGEAQVVQIAIVRRITLEMPTLSMDLANNVQICPT